MSRYTVIWWQAAEDELLRIWLDSSERSRINESVLEIDKLLSSRADTVGEASHEGLRMLEVDALRIQYSISEEDCLVKVWTVRSTPE